jgi:pimeloyl-ACP methyl ester carboxylesterase
MTSPLLQKLRRAWVTLGSIAFVAFVGWCLIAYRAKPEAASALQSDSTVLVTAGDASWTFTPRDSSGRRVNLVFLSGALVDPQAYAPLLHQVATHGYRSYLLALPWRGVFGKADGPDFLDHVRGLMDTVPGDWVVAGHSRGAKIAALVSQAPPPRQRALILIGTTHPRDFSLAHSRLRVTKIYGTADGVAPPAKVLANRMLLPTTTHWVAIEGGNHHQFGAYGFQPGDRWAAISPAAQQELTLQAMLEVLATVSDTIPPFSSH